MSIVLANESKAQLLEQERAYLNSCVLHLFVNDYVPVGPMTLADFVLASQDDGGYAPLTPLGFTVATLTTDNMARLLAPAKTWTFQLLNGEFTIYGYVVVDSATGKVVYADRALASTPITAAGMTYSVIPQKFMDTMPA